MGPPPRIAPFHLAIRFLLELALLAAYAVWGWHARDGGIGGLAVATLFVALAALVWGAFRVPAETPRGRAVVAVPGWLRLAVEVAVIALAAYGLWTAWSRAAAETLLTALAVHYALTWERIAWLLGRRQ